jgi:hypothetical protein
MMSCLLLGTIIVALPVWMTMPHRGGGLGYSVKDCAVVISTAGVVVLLAQAKSEQRIKVALRAFPVRTFRCPSSSPLSSEPARRVVAGSFAFFCFLLTQFGRIDRLQFTRTSGSSAPLHIPPPSSGSIGGTLLWLMRILLGIEHFTSPSAESDGIVVSGSYWIPTPSANPLTMVIPGILIGSVCMSSVHLPPSPCLSFPCSSCAVCFAYLTRKSAANLLHISLSSVISSPAKVQHCLSAAAAVLVLPRPALSALILSRHRQRAVCYFVGLTDCISTTR